ncbi:hypothetical protein ABMC89_13925 [Sulfitobacter sp. HNIBRBA3233]
MAQHLGTLSENASNPHRWTSNDEIYYCLSSIVQHAPWVRTIWLVVDNTTPDLARLPASVRDRLEVVYHHEIFGGFEHVLPTFNSLAIETMLWRIDGLADRFLYFNDDVFLTGPLTPEDMFDGDAPVLRGRWRDLSGLLADPAARDDPACFHGFMQINAGAMAGQPADRIFAPAHVVHPMRRSVMARLFAQHRQAFLDNIGHRFRDLDQFLPQALHNHILIAEDAARQAAATDHLHIRSGQGRGGSGEDVRALLTPDALSGVKFLCVNDLPQLEEVLPDARSLIAQAIGQPDSSVIAA